MIYLRQPAGYKGYCFYRITNGQIFIGTTAVFNETYFPRCPDGKQQPFMELGDEPPTENRYPDDPIDQSDDNNFGDQLPFPMENDNHPPSSPPSKPEVPEDPDLDSEHPSQSQRNLPALPP